MPGMGARSVLSVEQLAKLPDDGLLYELDEGKLITMAPASAEHGSLGAEIARVLANFVRQHRLGIVYNADTGFRLDEGTVRAPDVAFVRQERVAKGAGKGFFEGAPDLAVEIFSPSDSVPQLIRKVRQYLRAGSHTVWVVYPETREVQIFEASGADRLLRADDTLNAPELLPGFSVPVSALFE